MSGNESIDIRISPQQAEDFMKRLADDADFRDKLTQNPVEELGRYGINIPSTMLPAQVLLPSPDEIRQLSNRIDTDELTQFDIGSGNIIKFGPLMAAVMWLQKMSNAPGEASDGPVPPD
jgi:hypothetical protein